MKYLVALLLALVCVPSEANTFTKTFNLFEPRDYGLEVANARIKEDGNVRYWEPIDPRNFSMVRYRIDLPFVPTSSSFLSNSFFTAFDDTDALAILVAGGNQFHLTDVWNGTKNPPNVFRDVSPYVIRNYFYAEASFEGIGARAFLSDREKNEHPVFFAEGVPEPSTLLLLVAGAFVAITGLRSR